jgi:hypothetical protein
MSLFERYYLYIHGFQMYVDGFYSRYFCSFENFQPWVCSYESQKEHISRGLSAVFCNIIGGTGRKHVEREWAFDRDSI